MKFWYALPEGTPTTSLEKVLARRGSNFRFSPRSPTCLRRLLWLDYDTVWITTATILSSIRSVNNTNL